MYNENQKCIIIKNLKTFQNIFHIWRFILKYLANLRHGLKICSWVSHSEIEPEQILTLGVWWSFLLHNKGSRTGTQSLPAWSPDLSQCSGLSALQRSQTVTSPASPEEHRNMQMRILTTVQFNIFTLYESRMSVHVAIFSHCHFIWTTEVRLMNIEAVTSRPM